MTRDSSIRVEIELEENCEQLKLILEKLGNCGWEPSDRRYVMGNSETVFGVERWRNYTEEELDDFEYVSISFAKDRIAKFKRGGEVNVTNEDYVIKKGSENKNVPIGNLFPFRRFSINNDLKESLEKAKVAGLKCEPVVNSGSIWKLSSNVHLPSCLTPVVNGVGDDTDPHSWTELGDKYYDDGYIPANLRFSRKEVEALPNFDFAVTNEITGGNRAQACRECIVSQKLRGLLKGLNISTVSYAPVILEHK